MRDTNAHQIQRMFASIAHRYDLLNALLSLRFDRRWRRRTVEELLPSLPAGSRVLDLCTGTGDLALELRRGVHVVGCDFCHPMLILGQKKLAAGKTGYPVCFVEGDALHLPFSDGSFDAVTIAFGLRNLASYASGLAEICRVLRRGGAAAVLEFSQPQIPIFKQLYRFYLTRLLPKVGAWISGAAGPYSYLPQSVSTFPDPGQVDRMMAEAGLDRVRHRPLTGGIVTLHMGDKP